MWHIVYMKALIVGKGDVGNAVGKCIHEAQFIIAYQDPAKGMTPHPDFRPDVIHICIPFTDWPLFLKNVTEIGDRWPDAKYLVIESTITLGIAPQLQNQFPGIMVFHSPVRGTHPNIYGGLRKYTKFIGSAIPLETRDIVDFGTYYQKVFPNVEWVQSSEEAALGKLINTLWYANEIAFCNMVQIWCNARKINFNDAYTRFMESDEIGRKYEYDPVTKRAGAKELIPRPVMTPGIMGGKCIIPNLSLIYSTFGDGFHYFEYIQYMHYLFQEKTCINPACGYKGRELLCPKCKLRMAI